ncbi:MAG: efflux RND transporter permease subunit, partial [Gammaproteobacteria bacterium]
MLDRIVESAVRNRLLVLLALIALVGAAAPVLSSLNLDAFPDVTNVQVTVNTEAPGLAAEEVEQLITFPVEAVMYALPDVAEVRSISKTGLSIVTVVFAEGTDIYFARQLVFERLQDAKEQIPAGVGTPEMGPNTSGLGQVFQYILRADDPERFDAMALRSLNDWVVKLLLMPVDGVTEVLSFGGDVRQYQVLADPKRLLSYGLSVQDLSEAIEANNRNAGGWYLDRGAEQLTIRGVGWVRPDTDGLRDLGNVPLMDVDGVPVRVRDVAEVAFGPEIRQGAVTMSTRGADGTAREMGEVVAGIVLKRMGANTKATIDGIKVRLPAIQQALPDGVTIEAFYDQADLVEKAITTVTGALAQAFVLIVIVLALFLLNIRATLLVLISIPLSVGIALMVMAWWGVSANLMSLGGLAIAIGMMVDGSVVMMENIFKHLSRDDGEGGIALRIEEAAREVGRPVFFAVGVVVVVFAPLFTLQGVEGKLFQPMAVAIVLAMLASVLVALTVVPALASYAFRRPVSSRTSPFLLPFEWSYRWLLRGALRVRWLVLLIAL